MLANAAFWLRQLWRNTYPANEIGYLPPFHLEAFNTQNLTSDYLDAKLNIVIFFSLSDCPICLFEAEFWGKISQMYNDKMIKIIGITDTENNDNIETFCNEYSLSFPIVYDKNSHYKALILSNKNISKMNLHTPFKIFVDSHRRILLIEKANKNIEKQKQFVDKVRLFYEKATSNVSFN